MIIPPCVDQIAEYYHVQPASILQIIRKSHDGAIGPMGIQPGWLPILEKAGFSPEAVKNNACINIAAGAWILAYAVQNKPVDVQKPPSLLCHCPFHQLFPQTCAHAQ